MARLFSFSNTPAQDEAVARSIAGPIRLRLEELTPDQVVEVLYQIGYCPDCGADRQDSSGEISICHCTNDQ
jgi:hypothetical protein